MKRSEYETKNRGSGARIQLRRFCGTYLPKLTQIHVLRAVVCSSTLADYTNPTTRRTAPNISVYLRSFYADFDVVILSLASNSWIATFLSLPSPRRRLKGPNTSQIRNRNRPQHGISLTTPERHFSRRAARSRACVCVFVWVSAGRNSMRSRGGEHARRVIMIECLHLYRRTEGWQGILSISDLIAYLTTGTSLFLIL